MLCAGTHLADADPMEPPQVQYRKRLDGVLRLERFWALANVLATQESPEELPLAGLRGVQYAKARAETLAGKGKKDSDADFKMLARQVPYGAIGIYGAVADGMRLLERSTLMLTPDLGERLAEAFIRETSLPKSLSKAVREDGTVSLAVLNAWGHRAHLCGPPGPEEAVCLREALHQDPVRSRMAEVLNAHPPEDGNELARLQRIAHALENEGYHADLREAIWAILAYEECYRLAQLGLERLLWLCRHLPASSITPDDLKEDEVLGWIGSRLPGAVGRLCHALDSATTENFHHELCHLDDARQFLEQAVTACGDPWSLARAIMSRHADVQHGKFDRGRRKMPWLELVAGRISLTTTRVGGLNIEATRPDHIPPHPYRLDSADALMKAAGA
jgi:hypothetical protein